MPSIETFLTFASDAELLALWGAGFLALAVVANFAERRRMKHSRIDRIGWVPWMPIFLAAMVIGGGLLALALPPIIAG
ncbi:hypothetical protein [Altererythrobacter sp. MF3-039]|uniref:hypothetical protein n=1 Tax=Altererythrobacter sp. MF3-039 TaxID=3252901 RepID=UPI00390CBAC8